MTESMLDDTTVRFEQNGMVSIEHTPAHLVHITHHNAESRLLRLPAEIRNQIFQLAVDTGHIEPIYGIFGEETEEQCPLAGLLCLSQVCRQIYAETSLRIFLSNDLALGYSNLMNMRTEGSLTRRGRALTPGQRDAIRSIKVGCHTLSYMCNLTESMQLAIPSPGFNNLRLRDILPKLQQMIVSKHCWSSEPAGSIKKAGGVSLEDYVESKEGTAELKVSMVHFCLCGSCARGSSSEEGGFFRGECGPI